MYYLLHELNHAAMAPWRAAADATKLAWRNPANPLTYTPFARSMAAGAELFERTTRRYAKPEFGIAETMVDGVAHVVRERTVWSRPFCDLKRFDRLAPVGPAAATARRDDPKLLIVAPMSGHYATLLRGTVEAMLPHAEVHITDWRDARMVPLTDGRFDLDDYVDYVIAMLEHLGSDTHVMAVCQPAVPVLAAVAVMEAAGNPCVPATMTLMGGPIDTRVNPTAVNELAEEKPIEWFERRVIMRVPWPHPGFMRPVYPGFLQLGGFMSMNLDRHVTAHRDFFEHLVRNDGDSAEKHRDFYDEYLAVMDLTAEFYLQTVETVFIEHALPRGTMMHRGERVDPSAIRRTALLTIEGENDDISGVGQTEAAHALCSSIPEGRRMHHVQADVGHYGIFNGSRFRKHIVPRVVGFMTDHARAVAEGTPPADPIAALEGNETPAAERRRAEAPSPGPEAPEAVRPAANGVAKPARAKRMAAARRTANVETGASAASAGPTGASPTGASLSGASEPGANGTPTADPSPEATAAGTVKVEPAKRGTAKSGPKSGSRKPATEKAATKGAATKRAQTKRAASRPVAPEPTETGAALATAALVSTAPASAPIATASPTAAPTAKPAVTAATLPGLPPSGTRPAVPATAPVGPDDVPDDATRH